MNRNELQTAIARLLGDLLLEGTVDAGTTSGIADTELAFSLADQLKGKELAIMSAASPTLAGVSRTISASSVGSLSLTPSLPAAPTAGDTYHIYSSFKYQDYKQAIDEAVRRARDIHLIDASATLSIVATQWEYAVPSGFRYISDMWFVPSGSLDYADQDTAFRIPRSAWLVKANPAGSKVIAFDPRIIDLDDWDDELIRLYGQRRPAELSVGTTVSEIPESYLIQKAMSLLTLRKLGYGAEWAARFGYHNTEALRLERSIFRARRANAVEV